MPESCVTVTWCDHTFQSMKSHDFSLTFSWLFKVKKNDFTWLFPEFESQKKTTFSQWKVNDFPMTFQWLFHDLSLTLTVKKNNLLSIKVNEKSMKVNDFSLTFHWLPFLQSIITVPALPTILIVPVPHNWNWPLISLKDSRTTSHSPPKHDLTWSRLRTQLLTLFP